MLYSDVGIVSYPLPLDNRLLVALTCIFANELRLIRRLVSHVSSHT